MKFITKIGSLVITSGIILFIFTEVLRLFDSGSVREFRRQYNGDIVEPVEFISLFFVGIGIFLLFFNQTIQQSWWQHARWWFVAAAGIILFMLPLSTGGGFISFGGTTDLIVLWGVLFSTFTLIHTFYHRFWLKTGV